MPDDPLPSSIHDASAPPAKGPARTTEPVTDAQTITPAEAAPSGDRLPLPRVPGYEVLEEIARGGMGVVYKARQVSLNRTVALKMMLGGAVAGPDDLARFRKEAEAVARLEHPHIVRVYDFGTQDGLPFFTMEYVDGGSLKDRLVREKFSPREAASLVATLAHAMQHAHQAGIVHRDLKPANILLRGPSIPLITDFGLAKRLGAPGDATATGVVMGTAPYMAPEQASGRSREVGPHTDVWALGVLLYELLTGHPPFEGGSTLDILVQVVSGEALPPSRRLAGVPLALDVICLRCLAKEPARRYPSAGALGEALDHFLNTSATPPSQPFTAGYEVLQEVRHAGATTLYRARELATGAMVALRVIDLEACGSPEARAAAIRTAMLVGQLRHPHIAPLQAVSERHGRLLLQRDWAAAGTLADPEQRRTRTVAEAAALAEALASALDCAHRQGVMHRAVRPSNVLLAADGAPLLADFEPPGFPESPRDLPGSTAHAYLSPEQLASHAAPTAAGDLYALGVILYELLTGRHPYQAGRATVLLYQMKVGPQPPAQARPDLPPELNALCLQCLQADPRERPASAAALAAALGRILRPAGPGEIKAKETPSSGPSTWVRLFGWVRRPRNQPPAG